MYYQFINYRFINLSIYICLMGYELHIVRRNDYDDFEEESNITEAEWKAVVEADPELSWEGHINEQKYRYCYWMAYPDLDKDNAPWFDYFRGSISTKWTEYPCMRKMIRMAEALNARVEGDEGEVYTNEYVDELENKYPRKQEAVKAKKPFWKFW